MNEKEVADLSERLLSARGSLLSLWQEMADHFYPERASFTYTRYLGEDFADHLTTGVPVLIRRELGNSLSSMLREKGKQWFQVVAKDERLNEMHSSKVWLEWASKRQYMMMYDRVTGFVRATKEGDHDFATFGQTVISVEPNQSLNGLLYKSLHLRDCAWRENYAGLIDTFTRKWSPTARELVAMFPKTASDKVRRLANDPKKADTIINCRHVLMPAEEYGEKEFTRFKFVSMWVDIDNKTFLEKIGTHRFQYVIPRWQTVSGSQYAFSPATIVALPDARLIQAMALTLLEAGEKYTNPPLIATQNAVKSAVEVFAGGVTWVDSAYDERLGEALRPLTQDKSGFPFGLDMQADIREVLRKAFFIDKLGPLPMEKEMTAYEVGQIVQDWIRSALPLFEPMEVDYNGQLCENTFDLCMRMGLFGSPYDIPTDLQGEDIDFKFESPLHDNIERVKMQQFLEVKQLLAEAIEADQDSIAEVDIRTMFRDAVKATGAPTNWLRDPEVVEEMIEGLAAERQAQKMMEQAEQGANVIKTGAEARAIMPPAG